MTMYAIVCTAEIAPEFHDRPDSLTRGIEGGAIGRRNIFERAPPVVRGPSIGDRREVADIVGVGVVCRDTRRAEARNSGQMLPRQAVPDAEYTPRLDRGVLP